MSGAKNISDASSGFVGRQCNPRSPMCWIWNDARNSFQCNSYVVWSTELSGKMLGIEHTVLLNASKARTMIREQVVSALLSKDLAWHADFERPIDRLTALGLSDPLGAALWRFKYLHDRASYQRALHLLAHKVTCQLKVELSYARQLSTAAIKEYAIDTCDKCNGVGHIYEGLHAGKCKPCDGSGVKSYTDTERALAAGLPVESWPKHQKKFDRTVTCLVSAVAATGGKVSALLRDENYSRNPL
jgi:hypothetical protein